MRRLSEMPSEKVLTEEEVAKGELDIGGDQYIVIAVREGALEVVVVSAEGADGWMSSGRGPCCARTVIAV
jgi:hypothetical protein